MGGGGDSSKKSKPTWVRKKSHSRSQYIFCSALTQMLPSLFIQTWWLKTLSVWGLIQIDWKDKPFPAALCLFFVGVFVFCFSPLCFLITLWTTHPYYLGESKGDNFPPSSCVPPLFVSLTVNWNQEHYITGLI